jgi:phosphoribosylanthranilate isomerase
MQDRILPRNRPLLIGVAPSSKAGANFSNKMQTWIKFCGTTSLEDAMASIEAGADALGFIFAPSKRQITPEKAREIIRRLPESIERVGVFVNESADTIRDILLKANLTTVQLHGSESEELIKQVKSEQWEGRNLRVIKTIVVDGDFHLRLERFLAASSRPDAILLDSGAGSGQAFQWRGVRSFLTETDMRFIVAGGLNSENVGAALHMFRPYGVDVVSGVESAPGKKDPEKLKSFVTAVRNAEKEAWAAQH